MSIDKDSTRSEPSLSRRDLLRLSLIAGAGLRWGLGRAGAETPTAAAPAAVAAEATADPGRWLEAAVQAARWIHTARVESPQGVVWLQGPERPEGLSSSSDLYSGGAGVVLFLLEMARATGDPTHQKEALRGADALIRGLPLATDPSLAEDGLYTGVAGIGFALEQAYRDTGNAAYRKGADRCRDLIHAAARPAGAGVEWGEITDIIAGGAGTGLYLIHRAQAADDPASLELAARAGRRLVEQGIRESGGLKWRMASSYDRLMPNFSHGTAGVSYFLATLYLATKRQEFLDAALAGARYLKSVADTSGGGCLIFHSEPGGKDLYYLGWCHGPVGTARLWRQLARATGDVSWNKWMTLGARSIQASGIPEKRTPGFWNNAGQCCGLAGVGGFFLDLHQMRGDTAALAYARRVGEDLLRHGTAVSTPAGPGLKWIHAEHRAKPDYTYAQTGYMQGAAGIGMLFLQLDAAEKGREWSFRLPDSPFV
jgi:hypothetical protein